MSNISATVENKPSELAARLKNGTRPTLSHPLDNGKENSVTVENSEWDLSPNECDLKKLSLTRGEDSGVEELNEEEKSFIGSVVSPDTGNSFLEEECEVEDMNPNSSRRKIKVDYEILQSLPVDTPPIVEALNLFDNSVVDALTEEERVDGESSEGGGVSPIPELSAEEELEEARRWKESPIGGPIDMRVIEPYKRVLSHGGYLNSGSTTAIIVFSACFLPYRTRIDYSYVMDNLFGYVLATLDQLVTDDYVLVYLHGGTNRNCLPTFSCLKKSYQLIDRKLRKNLKNLYLVHPTIFVKTLVLMMRPFVSSKFTRKIRYIHSLSELYDTLPIEQACIPEKVNQFDRDKQSVR